MTPDHGQAISPGRSGEVRGFYVGNDRFSRGAASHGPCVRLGKAMYPDFANPRYGGDFTGGTLLTPDEADELGQHLRNCAAWARAQARVDGHEDMP